MWMVDPTKMCRNHLIGEHQECHTIVKCVRQGKINKLIGHFVRGQINTEKVKQRHDELVEEMKNRGYEHNSPMNYENIIDLGEPTINVNYNERVLDDRCKHCMKKFK